MLKSLTDATVVVVGGSAGIGFAVALAALQAHAKVLIIASSNSERVAKAVTLLEGYKLPGQVRGHVVDAKDTAAVKAFAESVGPVDHVAWTSGDLTHGITGGDGEDPEARAAAFAVRFWGPYVFAQQAKFRPGGSLTLTSGSLNYKPRPGASILSGVAASLEGLIKGLAVDLAPLRVNLVGPGLIKTEESPRNTIQPILRAKSLIAFSTPQIWKQVQLPPEALDKMLQEASSKLLIKRIGEPHEIAEAYIFLMKCGYITGQRINVDGGIALA